MKKLFLLAVILWNCLSMAHAATDFIYMTPVTGTSGSVSTISAMMSNPRATRACAFQCDLILPEGASVVDGSFELSERCANYVLYTRQLTEHSYRLLCYSPDRTPVMGTSGEVLAFDVRLGTTMEANAHIVFVRNVVIADDNTVCVFDQEPKEGTSQINVTTQYGIGDVNHDRTVSVDDIKAWTEAKMAGDAIGDINDDGKIDAVDLALLLDNLFDTEY